MIDTTLYQVSVQGIHKPGGAHKFEAIFLELPTLAELAAVIGHQFDVNELTIKSLSIEDDFEGDVLEQKNAALSVLGEIVSHAKGELEAPDEDEVFEAKVLVATVFIGSIRVKTLNGYRRPENHYENPATEKLLHSIFGRA